MSFYDAMAVVMKDKGITAAELARKTGIRKSYFTELKNGRVTNPSFEYAILIVRALGMKFDEFVALMDELSCK